MIKFRVIILFILMVLSGQTLALNLNGSSYTSSDGIYDTRSCHELYMQASALEKATYFSKSDIYSDKGAQVAIAASAAFTFPAVFYLGYKSYQNHQNNLYSAQALSEIDEIRHRMAEKRCFERN